MIFNRSLDTKLFCIKNFCFQNYINGYINELFSNNNYYSYKVVLPKSKNDTRSLNKRNTDKSKK